MYITHNCGELRIENIGHKVVLCGWIKIIRNLTDVSFIDIRDIYGITQFIFYEYNPFRYKACQLCRESVVCVNGTVIERSYKNIKNPTGDIEILVLTIEVLNNSSIPPFTIEENSDGSEELRMRYRYLDIRRNAIKNNLIMRHKIAVCVRQYLSDRCFLEIETPMLIKSTLEGSRNFVVPSRLHKGCFYALPQSPQIFKQLLMVGGIDKYFQIVKCFRDEDLRSDRQPEFTQIDCEMSFVDQHDIIQIFEGLIKHLFYNISGIKLKTPFKRIHYDIAINKYGTDKPDLRMVIHLSILNNIANCLSVFDKQELVAGIVVTHGGEYKIKSMDEAWKPSSNSRLEWFKYLKNGNLKSSLDKFVSKDNLKYFNDHINANPGDLLLIIAGDENQVLIKLRELRLEFAKIFGILNSNTFIPIWIVDFTMFKWFKKRFCAMHHPFTAPKESDIHLLNSSFNKVRSKAYDLVINGNEVGGGSIRIHNRELQEKILKILQSSKEEIQKNFGFFINALEYGAPPHGGIALGLDRLVALLSGDKNIRNFIAFPKNNYCRDLMIDSPAKLDSKEFKLST